MSGVVLLLALALVTGAPPAAAGEGDSGWRFQLRSVGPTAGVTLARVTGDVTEFGGFLGETFAGSIRSETGEVTSWKLYNDEGWIGFNVGAQATFEFRSSVALEIGLQYVRRGYRWDLVQAGTPVTAGGQPIRARSTLRLDYVEASGVLRFASPGSLRPYLVVGPTLGVMVDGTLETVTNRSFPLALENIDADELTRGFLVSGTGGAGVEIAYDAARFVIAEARYTMGLSNLLDGDDLSLKTGDLSVFLGISWRQ